MHIAVFSDVICPWCFIGKRRLDRAVEQFGRRDQITVEWLPFELNSDMPSCGMDRSAYRERKFGKERSAALDAHIRSMGEKEGIRFAFDRITRTPNTRGAHRLIAAASDDRRGFATAERLVEIVFEAYFEEGADIGDEEVLIALGARAGLDRESARSALRDDAFLHLVLRTEHRAAELGVEGAPHFIVEGRFAMSGAQPADLWLDALGRISDQSAASFR